MPWATQLNVYREESSLELPISTESTSQNSQLWTRLNIFHLENNLKSIIAHGTKINYRLLEHVVRQIVSHFLFIQH